MIEPFPSPILMYHRVAAEGPAELAPYRVSPDLFERQLSWLHASGYRTVHVDRIWDAPMAGVPPAKRIALTFDDAYEDFYSSAWPMLKRYDFSATVFVPTGYVGRHADWDAQYGRPARIMSWEQIIELHAEGVRFGSHGHRHTPLTQRNVVRALRDAVASRRILEKKLNTFVPDFCYPYSMCNRRAQLLVALAGYRYAVGGGTAAASGLFGRLHIPRIEILGTDGLEMFVTKVSNAQGAGRQTVPGRGP